MYILNAIDATLNKITMYRLALYVLCAYTAMAISLSALGVLSLPLIGMLLSLVVVLAVGLIANVGFAKLYNVPRNFESGIITTLILFCILPPATTPGRAAAIGLTVMVAMASKYIIAWRYKHIFNPAAIAVVCVSLFDVLHATWWVATPDMLPFTLVGGLLVARKLRRFSMVLTFTAVALAVMLLTNQADQAITTVFRNALLSWPLVFFATIMLTEPSTTPPARYYQVLYAGIVGALFASRLGFGPLYTTPEVALVLGNLFAYFVSTRHNVRLTLKEKRKLGPNMREFVFTPNRPPSFKPGQYMEWTVPPIGADSRGNRRTFTIASSPTEPDVRLGVRFYERPSTFKRTLSQLVPGQTIMAGHIAGDFVLPADASQKLVFIAGGIGITPFRSMAKYLADSGKKRDIVLFHAVASTHDTMYSDVFAQAKPIGVKTCYLVDSKKPNPPMHGYQGVLTKEILETEVPDYAERIYYVSGPPHMVRSYRKLLRSLGISPRKIKTDLFAGY